MITHEDILNILGKPRQSVAFASFLRKIAERPVISQPTSSCRFYEFYASGLSVGYHPQLKTVYAAWIHGTRGRGFRKYRGTLPQGLDFRDTRLDVRRKLRMPIQSSRHKNLDWDLYQQGSLELHCEYNGKEGGRLILVTLQLPGDWQSIL